MGFQRVRICRGVGYDNSKSRRGISRKHSDYTAVRGILASTAAYSPRALLFSEAVRSVPLLVNSFPNSKDTRRFNTRNIRAIGRLRLFLDSVGFRDHPLASGVPVYVGGVGYGNAELGRCTIRKYADSAADYAILASVGIRGLSRASGVRICRRGRQRTPQVPTWYFPAIFGL